MKNADMPATPITEEETDRINDGVEIFTGLTKREHFVVMAMQAMLSSKYFSDFATATDKLNHTMASGLAENAIIYADALLEELSK